MFEDLDTSSQPYFYSTPVDPTEYQNEVPPSRLVCARTANVEHLTCQIDAGCGTIEWRRQSRVCRQPCRDFLPGYFVHAPFAARPPPPIAAAVPVSDALAPPLEQYIGQVIGIY